MAASLGHLRINLVGGFNGLDEASLKSSLGDAPRLHRAEATSSDAENGRHTEVLRAGGMIHPGCVLWVGLVPRDHIFQLGSISV